MPIKDTRNRLYENCALEQIIDSWKAIKARLRLGQSLSYICTDLSLGRTTFVKLKETRPDLYEEYLSLKDIGKKSRRGGKAVFKGVGYSFQSVNSSIFSKRK